MNTKAAGMHIEIRDGDEVPAVIIIIDTKPGEFDSDYERNKFFRGLHGWKQTVPVGEKMQHSAFPAYLFLCQSGFYIGKYIKKIARC